MPDGLYERDALLWSEQQADLLRRLATGERVNDSVDWPNVIEEVEAMGRSELRACESFLVQALVHLLKLHAWPESTARQHWTDETFGFLDGARRAFTPSMRHRIDLDELFGSARRRVDAALDESGPARAMPAACPFTLNDLLGTMSDPRALAAMLTPA